MKGGRRSLSQSVCVIGRRSDISARTDRAGFEVLRVPDQAWSEQLNRAWIEQAIALGLPFLVVSAPIRANLWKGWGSLRRKTVFAQELEQLLRAGYAWSGPRLLLPRRAAAAGPFTGGQGLYLYPNRRR